MSERTGVNAQEVAAIASHRSPVQAETIDRAAVASEMAVCPSLVEPLEVTWGRKELSAGWGKRKLKGHFSPAAILEEGHREDSGGNLYRGLNFDVN